MVSDLWDDNDGVISYQFAYRKSLNSRRAGTCVPSIFVSSEPVLVRVDDSFSSLCELLHSLGKSGEFHNGHIQEEALR